MKKKELLKKIEELHSRTYFIPNIIPSVWSVDLCPSGGSHEYPFPWHSVSPAPCKKCGQTNQSITITCNSSSQINQ